MKLQLRNITRLLGRAYEKKLENKMWDLYVVKYQHMDEKTYKPFEEFYNPNKKESDKSEIEILREVKESVDTFNFMKKEGDENADI